MPVNIRIENNVYGVHVKTSGDLRRSAIESYFNADNSFVRMLKRNPKNNYFIGGIIGEFSRGKPEFNKLGKKLNNAFTLEKLKLDLQDENKISTKDLFELYNKNLKERKNLNKKKIIFDVSDKNMAKFIKKHVGFYGFKKKNKCDCAEEFTYILNEAINNRKNDVIKNISDSINNCQRNQLEELQTKCKKLMKKTTLLHTKVNILTELYFHGKQDVLKRDVNKVKKDMKELIKNKKTKNFSDLLETVQKELNIRTVTREGIISF